MLEFSETSCTVADISCMAVATWCTWSFCVSEPLAVWVALAEISSLALATCSAVPAMDCIIEDRLFFMLLSAAPALPISSWEVTSMSSMARLLAAISWIMATMRAMAPATERAMRTATNRPNRIPTAARISAIFSALASAALCSFKLSCLSLSCFSPNSFTALPSALRISCVSALKSHCTASFSFPLRRNSIAFCCLAPSSSESCCMRE